MRDEVYGRQTGFSEVERAKRVGGRVGPLRYRRVSYETAIADGDELLELSKNNLASTFTADVIERSATCVVFDPSTQHVALLLPVVDET